MQYWERVKEGDMVMVFKHGIEKRVGRVAGTPTPEATPVGFKAGHDPEMIPSRDIAPLMSDELARGLCEVLEETKEWSKKE